MCFSNSNAAAVMFLYVLLLVARVLMFAQELLRFRNVRHIPLASLCSLLPACVKTRSPAPAQPQIPPSASLQSPGCNTAALRCREILRILHALNMDENLIDRGGRNPGSVAYF